MGKCIFEDVCDKSWCRLYSFECVDGQIYKQKTSNEQFKTRCSQCDKWGCSHRNLITDNCDLEKYETHITNALIDKLKEEQLWQSIEIDYETQ